MSKVRIYGDTSGYVDIDVPAEAGTRTLNLDKIPQTDTSGNTGIGTDTPSTKLHVKSDGTGNSFGSLYLQVDTPTNHPAMVIQTSTGGNDSETHGLYIKNTANGYGLRIDDAASDTSPVVVTSDGKLGIGLTTPDRALHIEGSDFSSSTIRLKRTSGGENNDAGLQFQSAAGANDGYGMGGIWFQNSLDGNAYALMRARTDDATGTSGRFEFMTNTAGNAVSNFTTPRVTIHNDGAVSMPAQPVGYRRNTHTTNGWVTLTNGGVHNIFSNWYTPSAYQQHTTADTIDNSGRYYAPKAGWYMVNPEIYSTTGSVTTGVYGYLNVYKNGSNQFGGHIINYGGDTNDKLYSNSVLVYMTDTDYIQIGVYVAGTGGTFQVYSPYCGYWVRFLG